MPYPRNPTVEALVQGFQSVPASTIGHLHEEGYLAGVRAMLPGSKLVGVVRTAKIHLPNASVLKEALIQAQAGEVLVIECLGNPNYACWGELRTLAAKVKDLAGVIVSGPITDLRAVQTHQLPVFATGVSALTTRPDSSAPHTSFPPTGTLNEPIQLAGHTVKPGDIAIGDDDGLFVISPQQAERLLPLCLEKESRDQQKRRELMAKISTHHTL